MPFFYDHGGVSSVSPDPPAEPAVCVFIRDVSGNPQAVRIEAFNEVEFTRAMELIRLSYDSFVVYDGLRYFSTGEMEPYRPEHPASSAELALLFDVEYIATAPDGRQRVYIFTRNWEEWEMAQLAVTSLMQREELSGRSYIEYDPPYGAIQGISAARLMAGDPLDDLALVQIERYNAYNCKNGLPEEPDDSWPERVPHSYWA
jgi:hypothetical protein